MPLYEVTDDGLQQRGRLDWRWDYANRRAIFHVRRDGGEWQTLDTLRAEAVAQAEFNALGIRWKPVPHPGGETQHTEVDAWIARSERL
jgi:hypothetical protein